MTARTGRLLLAALGVAATAWIASRFLSGVGAVDTTPAPREAEPSSTAPTLASGLGPAADARPEAEAATRQRIVADAKGDLRALLPDGTAARGGTAWWLRPDRTVAAKATIGADGSYRPSPPLSSEEGLTLVVAPDGAFATTMTRVGASWWTISVGTDSGMDTPSTTETRTFDGWVIRHDGGAPVAGVEVRVLLGSTGGGSVPESWTGSLDALVATGPSFGVGRTDAEGRFAIQGVPYGFVRLVSGSPEWFFDEMEDHDDRRPGRVVPPIVLARPRATLHAQVVDAVSGQPVPRFEGHLHQVDDDGFVAFGGSKGVLAVAFGRWWDGERPTAFDLDVEAKGYAPARVPVRYEARTSDVDVRVAMEPVRPDGDAKLTFEIVDEGGKPIAATWWARIVDAKSVDKTIQEVPLRPIDAVRHAGVAPPGRWNFLVKTGEGLGYLRWTGERTVVAGENAPIRCVMPPYGSLRVELPDDPRVGPAARVPLGLTLAGTIGSMVTAHGTEYKAPALPEGDYSVEVGSLLERVERKFRIRAGEETVVSFRTP